MSTITLTSKRQATFPASLCAELQIGPGDTMDVAAEEVDGERVWVIRPRKGFPRPWLRCLDSKTGVQDHSMESIRASISVRRGKQDS
jgi:bifunctional DNA-binding transcriptional regulator/antitoxin component of YhaV-PrlF toxin-antitoxin module